jgi:type I restriction-modification system DNA methylase subunit
MPVDERTFMADVAGWVSAILERRQDLPYSRARVEEHGVGNRKRHDFVLYRRGIQRVALSGEAKMPDSPKGKSPLDGELVEDAYEKASRRGTPYYFTWNVRDFALFQTHQEGVPFMDRLIEGPQHVVDISVSDDVRRPEIEAQVKSFWEDFLARFADLEAGRRPLENLPLDRRFILRLENDLSEPIAVTLAALEDKYGKDADFRARLDAWMVSEQGWEGSTDFELLRQNLDRSAHLSCYVLVTRLVFYQVLRRRFTVLASLGSSQAGSSEELFRFLSARFSEAITYSRDYETILTAEDLGSTLPFLASEAHRSWHTVVNSIEDFDFSRLDFEIIGQLYERLIGESERRKYGQFYTIPEVVDIINAFCIRSTTDEVLDPACGGGTFLVRAYARKRALAERANQEQSHQQLIGQIFGVDVAAFAAQLATINLAVRHLSDEANYPRVARADFFYAEAGVPLYHVPLTGNAVRDIALRDLDAVVGNPPYLRQERLATDYKTKLANLLRNDWPGMRRLSGRSDIYAYFFAHAGALLKPGGYLGFVTSIGWLDTDYGFRLQEFFLKNFKIIAVLESQVEKWFEDARVTTAVTILQREPDEEARHSNLVRSIQLRKPLREIYSEALHGPVSEQSEAARQADMDAVRELIEDITGDQTTDYWRVRVLTQGELWSAGSKVRLTIEDDAEEAEQERAATGPAEYQGGKWGQYVRAPDVWFELLDHAGGRMVPLHELAEIRRGFTSGVDKFYCVRDVTDVELRRQPDPAAFRAKWGITPKDLKQLRIVGAGDRSLHLVEARFLEPEFHSLMEAKAPVIRAADVGRRVINAPVSRAALRGTKLADYVRYAEEREWHVGPTVASRAQVRPWYDLGLRPKAERAEMFWPKSQQYRHIVPWNEEALPGNDNLYDVWATDDVDKRLLWAVLNCTVVALAKHQFGRAAGIEGNLKTGVVDVNMMLVPDVRQASSAAQGRAIAAAERMTKRLSARTLPEELSLADRQELDDSVLEMLGFTDAKERLAVRSRLYVALTTLYAATRDRELVAQKDRLRSKRKGQMTPAEMADELWEGHHPSLNLLKFPDDSLHHQSRGQPLDLPPGPVEVGTAMLETGRRLRAGTIRVGGPTGEVLEVGSVARARFAQAASLCGIYGTLTMPDDTTCEEAIHAFETYRKELAQQFSVLASQRTRDERKQRAITETLIRKALAWSRVGETS